MTAENNKKQKTEVNPPKVFISYSWTSVEHKDRIRHYAERLRNAHVDVLLDIWDLAPGQDKNAYMEKMVTDPTVTHVLAFIDRRYTEKANARADGVGTESQIISHRLYSSTDQQKFIPVFCEKDDTGKLSAPVFFEARIGFDFSTPAAENDNWEPLVRHLFGKPEYIKPPLGPLPAFLDESNAPREFPTDASFRKILAKTSSERHWHLSLNEEFLSQAFKYLDSFRIRVFPKDAELAEYDEIVYGKLQGLLPFRDQFIEWAELQILSMEDEELLALLKSLVPRFSEVRCRGPELQRWYANSGVFDVGGIWVYEVLLYVFAMLLKHKRDKVAASLLASHYYMFVGNELTRKDFYPIDVLWSRAVSFTRRNERLKLHRLDLLADWIKEHAKDRFADFNQLMEADGVLCLKSMLSERWSWWPRTYVYSEYSRPPELFDAARDKGHAERLLVILGYSNLEELKNALRQLRTQPDVHRVETVRRLLEASGFEKWGTLSLAGGRE
ncbi:MAG: toll/interleukin-1 receptor domain-containing protein [Kiritimatiellae bacterium]|nr:toll/interleukin-1 receptor domain-containing protein [Kiritimatiellia bacterium]